MHLGHFLNYCLSSKSFHLFLNNSALSLFILILFSVGLGGQGGDLYRARISYGCHASYCIITY